MDNLDFIPRTPGSGNPLEGRPTKVFWKCEHGDTKGPNNSDELRWDGGHCEVLAWREAVENDPAEAEVEIYASCNIINHLARISPARSKSAIYRIIKGENHRAVVEDEFQKLDVEDLILHMVESSFRG